MSHLRFCLLAFLVGFAYSIEYTEDCNKGVPPGSENTKISPLEKFLSMKEIKDKIEGWIWNKFEKKDSQSMKEIKDKVESWIWNKFENKDSQSMKEIKDKVESWIWNKFEKKDSQASPKYGNILDTLNMFSNLSLVAPGLKWCGDGDIAENIDDLGIFKKTDACCRGHDLCKNNILAGEELLNLKNNGIFTRSSCTCDGEFYNCMKKVDGVEKPIATVIGTTYFNKVKPQCFHCSCPIEECTEDDNTECKDKCTKYKWVDNPNF